MNDLEAFARLVPLDHGLVVVSTARADGTIQSSVVNAGVLDHPVTNRPVRVMANERRVAVLVEPERIYGTS